MKKVRCISPHGGCHHGRYHNGDPVRHVWKPDGEGGGEWALPDLDPAKLSYPPNPGGYVEDARIRGLAAVGQVYDVPDGFHADGFHWEDVKTPPPPAKTPLTDEGK